MKTRTNSWLLTLIMVCSFGTSSFAQQFEVSGRVTDASTNESLIAVNVQVKGTTRATITDKNGVYKISAALGQELIFSFIGYTKFEVVVTGPVENVKLTANYTTLNEVQVVGYGSRKMVLTTGAVTSASNMLSGRMSGVQFTPANVNFGCRTVVQANQNTEEYGSYKENRFFTAKDQSLSTFSLDVDAASYSNMRRMINQGQMPPKEAIRIEELINYFSYNYPQPIGKDPVKITTEVAICPWADTHRLVRIGVKAKEIPGENLPASNLVFLLDVSGSMGAPNKLDLVKSSIKLLSNNLRSKDRVAIVVYAGAAGVVLPSVEGTDRQKITEAIENLHAGGSTAGGAGIELAYKIAEKNFIQGGNNRIILCTDGDFNVGISSTNELENMIESKRKTGIFLTVLGYGMGNYKDNKLQVLSEKGNGNHAYIDNIQEANKVLVNEFGSTMYTVAKDVKIQVEFNPAYVNAYRLIGYESRLLNKEDFNDDTKDAGELGSGHTVTALYEVIPVGVKNTFGGVDELKYQKAKAKVAEEQTIKSNEMLTVKLRYKQPDGNKSEKLEVPVLANEISAHPSTDFQFVMAVTMFGQLLRESDFKGTGTYNKVIDMANNGVGKDNHGYRKEFIRLVESVNQLVK